ncbi:hypothetical protein PR048_009308 [Dryococelus australis]|uniref:CCHC-type domain-containing protein n=1 Tax=Dryococelus australis TaxID=614101 RepID=A0ABQ9HZL8_9NEOP|nr:hypothetical protein PR048_009308 [Dryococelus australis]
MMSANSENTEAKNSVIETGDLPVNPLDLKIAVAMPQLVQWLQFIECYEAKIQQDVDVFIDTINNVANMLGWKEAEKVMSACLSLKGQALTVLKANPHMKTKHFKVADNKEASFDKFFNCVQRQGESVREYATYLRLVNNGTISNGPTVESVRAKVLEETTLTQFLKGIRGSIQRFVLSRVPQTFEQAVQFEESEEQNELLANNHSVVPGSLGHSVRFAMGSKMVKCHSCGSLGHVGRDCQLRRCFICNRVGHLARHCRGESRIKCGNCGEDDNKTEACRVPKCKYCNRLGHLESNCFKKNNLNKRGHQPGPQAGEARKSSCDHFEKKLYKEGHLYSTVTLDLIGKIDIEIENEICRQECIVCSDDIVLNADGLLGLDFFNDYTCKIDAKERTLEVGKTVVSLSEGNLRGTSGVIIKTSRGTRGKCCRDGSEKAFHVLGLAGVCVTGSQCTFEGDGAPVKYKEASVQCKLVGSGAPVFVSCREVESRCSVVGERCHERYGRQDATKVKERHALDISRAPVKLEKPQKAINIAALQTNDGGQKLSPRVKGNLQSIDGGPKPGSWKMDTNMTLQSRGGGSGPDNHDTHSQAFKGGVVPVLLQRSTVIPPRCELTCRGKIEAPEFCEVLIKPKGTGQKIVMSRSLCKVSKEGSVPMKFINESQKFIKLERNLEVGLASTLSNVAETTGGTFVVSSKRKLSVIEESETSYSESEIGYDRNISYFDFANEDVRCSISEQLKLDHLCTADREFLLEVVEEYDNTNKCKTIQDPPKSKTSFIGQIDAMLESGIIVQSSSPWSALIILLVSMWVRSFSCVEYWPGSFSAGRLVLSKQSSVSGSEPWAVYLGDGDC